MNWLGRLRPGSFRGVEFRVDDHEFEGGRRVHVHEYAFQDEPFAEDLGAAAPRFTVQAYVIGPDYDRTRDALVEACNKAGPGTLVHPYRGEVTVACEGMKVRESRREGRIAHFELKFVRTVESADYPKTEVDTRAAATARATEAETTAAGVFEEITKITGLPDFVADKAREFLDDLADVVEGLPVITADGVLIDVAGGVARRASLVEAIADLVPSVSSGVASIASAIRAVMGAYRLVVTEPGVAETGLGRITAFAAGRTVNSGAGIAGNAITSNENAMVALVEQVSLSERVRASVGRTFTNYDEAAALRSALVSEIETAATRAADRGQDQTFLALRSLKQAAAADLTTRAASLARVTAYSVPDVMPALALSQRLYADSARAGDLVARNAAVHPLFLKPQGVALAE